MNTIKQIIAAAAAVSGTVLILLLLMPLEKRNREYKEYPQLAEAAETDSRARTVLDNIGQYPPELIKEFNEAFARKNSAEAEKKLSLLNDYPEHKDDYMKMSFTDAELNSQEVPALYMDDRRWAYEKIGGELIESNGCAALSITMASLYLNRSGSIDPVTVSEAAKRVGALNFLGGISSGDMKNVCESLGFECTYYDYENNGGFGESDIATLRDIIEKGHVAIAGFVGDTFGSHALVVTSCSGSGIMRINDPANEENTGKDWDITGLYPEIYYLWELS